MKTLLLMALLFPFTLFSQETNSISLKNISFSSNSSGVSSNGVGITCKEIFIKINGKEPKNNSIRYNDKIELNFDNIKGFVKKGNKVFPKMELKIVNANNEVVSSNPNLLDGLQGTDLSPLQLFASFKANLDIADNYTAIIKITDANGTGYFNYKYRFNVIKASVLNIKMSDNVMAENIFLWNDTKKEKVTETTLNINDTYIIVFENITGLNNTQDIVYPIFSMKLDNHKGHTILDVNHLLRQYETAGIDAASVAKNQITGKITFNKGSIDNPYIFEAKVIDKKSNKSIEVKAVFTIKK